MNSSRRVAFPLSKIVAISFIVEKPLLRAITLLNNTELSVVNSFRYSLTTLPKSDFKFSFGILKLFQMQRANKSKAIGELKCQVAFVGNHLH